MQHGFIIMEALAEQLNCGICHGRLVDSKSLLCLHTYCKACLDMLLKSKPKMQDLYGYIVVQLPCPFCQKTTTVTDGNVNNLKTNFIINNVLDALETLEKEETSKQLSSPSCEKHGVNDCHFYCDQCDVIVDCNECAINDHFLHVNGILGLQQKSQNVVKKLELLVEMSHSRHGHHSDYHRKISQIQKCGIQAFDYLERQLSSSYEKQRQKLDDAKGRICRDIAIRRSSFKNDLQELLNTSQKARSRITNALNEADRLSQDLSKAREIVSCHKSLIKETEEALAVEIPSTYEARCKLDSVKSLRFDEDNTRGTLGRLVEGEKSKALR